MKNDTSVAAMTAIQHTAENNVRKLRMARYYSMSRFLASHIPPSRLQAVSAKSQVTFEVSKIFCSRVGEFA